MFGRSRWLAGRSYPFSNDRLAGCLVPNLTPSKTPHAHSPMTRIGLPHKPRGRPNPVNTRCVSARPVGMLCRGIEVKLSLNSRCH